MLQVNLPAADALLGAALSLWVQVLPWVGFLARASCITGDVSRGYRL